MEPVTLALTAFSAIKAGVAAGKEIHALAKDIGQLFDAVDSIKNNHSSSKNSTINKVKGVNEEALETFMALQKAKDIEDELREIIIYTRGMQAWQDLLRIRAQIKKQRHKQKLLEEKRKRETTVALVVGLASVLGVGAVVGFVMWLIAMKH